MNQLPDEKETICAISTPQGLGGIGIVRLSGAKAKSILENLWRGVPGINEFETRKLYLGKLTTNSGELIDTVMAVFMAAPNTYTGQDIVEFHAHGSPVILRRIVAACIDSGARLAAPGEFTKRAFLAGKMDLIQAEAVSGLIAATTERAARLALAQLGGSLSIKIRSISEALADVRAEVEAAIDFPEEDIPRQKNEELLKKIRELFSRITAILSTFDEGRMISEGVSVAIVGEPNAGKSSIFNRLVGHERAIVHSAPGTTRDIIEESIMIDGMIFRLKDTAGIRDDGCEIERLGIARTMKEADIADVVIAVFDASKPDNTTSLTEAPSSRRITVLNKCDLKNAVPSEKLAAFKPILISAKTGEGFEILRERLLEFTMTSPSSGEDEFIVNERQNSLLDESCVHLGMAVAAIDAKSSPEFTASHLRDAQDTLGKITGEVSDEDILERIFSRFCIGK